MLCLLLGIKVQLGKLLRTEGVKSRSFAINGERVCIDGRRSAVIVSTLPDIDEA
jgi:hypothetical protein